MAPVRCPICGTPKQGEQRYCPTCGSPFPWTQADPPMGRRYWGWRFQVDPLEPAPRRDPRYVMIVVGIALLVLGVLFLAVSAIVGGAISAGGGCGPSGCPMGNPGDWFVWVGLPFLLLGIALFGIGLWWGLR